MTHKARKTLPEPDSDVSEFTAKEFVAAAFPKNEKQLLVTLVK